MSRDDGTPSSDLAGVRRAGRNVAIQASAALAVVLLLVGLVVAGAYLRAQTREIDNQLQTVAMEADDTDDPPPGTELALRDIDGVISASAGGKAGIPLLAGRVGFSEVDDNSRHYRALVVDRAEGRVVAMVDLAPYRAGRTRLFWALAAAELSGIMASALVVVLFTRRSVRPLAQALALQRRFVADASHELRAPLTVLHTRAQLLATRLHSTGPEAAAREAEALVADTRVLNGVVDDLLASATFTSGRPGGAALGAIDVGALCQTVCASMGAYADSVDVDLVCEVHVPAGSAGPKVVGSEAALRRALTAVIDNALNHARDRGAVRVAVWREGQNAIVSVVDDGVGIDEATMATLFNRFSRGAANTSRAGRQSYGIGLALVREIVRGHGGDITVTSGPGQGAAFTIALPAAAEDL
jgi:signal transduction histidine kinase